jgi:two-component system, NtrC family, response regulator AtoC
LARILVIDDEDNLRLTIARALGRSGHEISEASRLADARARLAHSDFDLVLTDIMLGEHQTGLDLVRELRAAGSGFDGVIVVMTAFSSVDTAVAAMRDGADDYLQKPLSLEELNLQVARWLEHRKLVQRIRLYKRLEQSREHETEVVGESPSWRQALSLAERLARIPLPGAIATGPAGSGRNSAGADGSALPCILITGETGAGKGVMARYIHAQALAAEKLDASEAPFVHVNCSALPATLVEGELFGHEKGAFTDARDAKPGLFEMADGGTIFLDEVSETPLEFQTKLLTVVEQGVYRRVGGTRERRVRVRVIAASNQNLEARVKAGAFRRDLLYRLNAFTLVLPALRQRSGDAIRIAETMLDRLCKRYGRAPLRLSDEARLAIDAHPWPGNVRELVNGVHRAVMLSDGLDIEPEDLGLDIAPPLPIGASAPAADDRSRVINAGLRSLGASPDPSLASGVFPPSGQGPAGSTARVDEAHAQEHTTQRGEREAAVGVLDPTGVSSRIEVAAAPLVFDFQHGVHTAAEVEKELIMQALRHTRGNVSRAAKLIAMQRSSLRYRIDRYQLESFVVEVAGR